jgi:hypothetical protein
MDESLVFLDQGVEPDTHTPLLGPRQAEQLCRRGCPHQGQDVLDLQRVPER